MWLPTSSRMIICESKTGHTFLLSHKIEVLFNRIQRVILTKGKKSSLENQSRIQIMAKKLDLLKASYICDIFHFDSKNIVESGI